MWAGVAFVLASIVASVTIDRSNGGLPLAENGVPSPFHAIDACSEEPISLPGGRRIGDERVALRSNGIARGLVCTPTRLTAIVEPRTIGASEHVVVSWRGSSLWEAHLEGPQRLVVELPGPGWVAIGSVTVPTGTDVDLERSGLWIFELSVAPSP